MGLIAFPFIFCFILAIVGSPFLVLFFLSDKAKLDIRSEEMSRERKASAFYSRRCIEATKKGKPLSDKECEAVKEDAYRIYGVRF